jgi:hypothetical protein
MDQNKSIDVFFIKMKGKINELYEINLFKKKLKLSNY